MISRKNGCARVLSPTPTGGGLIQDETAQGLTQRPAPVRPYRPDIGK